MRNETLKRSVGGVFHSVVADSVVRSELLIPRRVVLTSSTGYAVDGVAIVVCEAAARSAGRAMGADDIVISPLMTLWSTVCNGMNEVKEIERFKRRHGDILLVRSLMSGRVVSERVSERTPVDG
jgi:hypothetical protein